jgi:hypothetical protein
VNEVDQVKGMVWIVAALKTELPEKLLAPGVVSVAFFDQDSDY